MGDVQIRRQTMTEEEKKCECKTCKCKEYAKKFLFISGAVFVGATLAILVSANILKPKCPPPMYMMGPRMGIERQLPPPAFYGQRPPQFYGGKCPCKCHKHHKGDFNPQKENFPKPSVNEK